MKKIKFFKKKDKNKNFFSTVIILDNIRSMNNIGSVFRIADSFLIKKIYLCGISGTPPHKHIYKTSLGSEKTVKWFYYKNIDILLRKIKNKNYKIIIIEQVNKSINLQNFLPSFNNKYCLIFGNEIFGINKKLLSKKNIFLEIPQYGTKHSLNISISVGIVLWHFFNKLN